MAGSFNLSPDLLSLLDQSGGGGGGSAGAASVSPLSSLGPTLLTAGAPAAPATFGLSELPGLVMTLLGMFGVGAPGVPRDAKSESIAQALSGSPNQLQALLGGLLQKGINQGNVLSEGGPSTLGGAVERTAGMLEALTGQQIPGVTGSGAFQNQPTLDFTKLGRAADRFQLPAGYQFMTNPTDINTAYNDITKLVGTQAPTGQTASGASDWQHVINELISQGALQRYQGSLGAPGGSSLGGGNIPNVSLPHPLTNTQTSSAFQPYPG